MKQLLLVLISVLLGIASGPAMARKPKAGEVPDEYVNKDLPEAATVWHCWYGGAISIRCRLGEHADAASGAGIQPGHAVEPRLPELVKAIGRDGAAFAGRVISIPLHTNPYDMALAGKLAEAVMCAAANRPCGVIFGRNAALLSELVATRSRQLAAAKSGRVAIDY